WGGAPRRFRGTASSRPGSARALAITRVPASTTATDRTPKGNRQMRRVLNQAANAAVKAKGSLFALVYRPLVPRLGHAQAIGAIPHRLCRLIWKILPQGIRYEERRPAVNVHAKKARARKMIRELRSLGYCLTADTRYHKFLIVEGDGENGKSVLLDTLASLLGPANVSRVPLEIFGERFQLMATFGKLANIAPEVDNVRI